MFLCEGASINSGESTYRIQAFYDDCEGTGRRYASLEHKVLVSTKTPIGRGEGEEEAVIFQNIFFITLQYLYSIISALCRLSDRTVRRPSDEIRTQDGWS